MGTTYSNCQVRIDSQEAVVAALTGLLKEPAYVGPAVNGWVGVYPEGYSDAAETLAKKLSAKLSCGVFFWSVYDSDIFFYTLYEDGKKRDEFDSSPDYFDSVSTAKKARLRGKPEALLPYCLPGITSLQVREVLQPPLLSEEEAAEASGESLLSDKTLQTFARLMSKTLEEMKENIAQERLEKYTFAEEQAEDLAKMLGMDETLSALDCKYIENGESSSYTLKDFYQISHNQLTSKNKRPELWDIPMRLADVKAAIDGGLSVNEYTKNGEPFLLLAAEKCTSEVVQFLLNAGADVNTATAKAYEHRWERGVTALMAAVKCRYVEAVQQVDTVQILINAGADVNARSEEGRTALKQVHGWQNYCLTYKPSKYSDYWHTEQMLAEGVSRGAALIELLRAAGATE